MTIEAALTGYTNFLKGRLKSVNTQKTYLSAINRFLTQGGFNSFDEIKPDSITAFLIASRENGAGGSSGNTYLAALRSFFGYLYRNEYTVKDYSRWEECRGVEKVKADSLRGKRQYNEPEEPDGRAIPKLHQIRIINAALKNTARIRRFENYLSTEGERNALMIRIGWSCGFRVSDLVSLKAKNFDFQNGKVKVLMKKVRRNVEFHVGEGLMNEIKAYVDKNELNENDYLFPTAQGEHIAENSFWAAFQSILKTAGLPAGKENRGYSVHDLRRTCATLLYADKHISLKEVSTRLGHKNISVTESYLRLKDVNENTDAVDKAIASAFV